ncbi:jg25941, partial [Pararge aegeria aegeria]
ALIKQAKTAVPIDIEIEKPGSKPAKSEPKFVFMIPDKKPLISRRRELPQSIQT